MNHQSIDHRRVQLETGIAVQHLATIDSTNTRALQRLGEGTATPFLISADQQTAGRGRSGNQWYSPNGALMFTLVVDRTESAAELPPYSLAAGLAVRNALQSLSPDVALKVKWPNDVYLEDRKVCGILVEVPPANRNRLLVGIGVNVNNSVMNAPEELRQRLGSMLDIHGHTFCRTTTLIAIVNNVLNEITKVRSDAHFVERWREHCWLSGKRITVTRGSDIVEGVCVGINESGSLLLQNSTEVVTVKSGVVTRVEQV